MTLNRGATFGPYEIVALIGAGGMGEVYRAHDTKLKRDVALKVLPDAFASDPGRMARFQREAEVLASLNHPNIAHIYGIEDRALVMELVEGDSPKGPMSFDDAWKIAMQIADALEYAHDRGVIHRDLKPANVKVTPDGVVKLLDFGLAKALSPEPGEAQLEARATDSPTLTMGATVAGVILGTAAYMAPEQAKGRKVDKRADIWSWGVVLYELLTGERMFQGDDTVDTLAQVLTKQPDLGRVPPKARRLLAECLLKDPKLRLRDIGDARRLLAEELASVTALSRSLRTWIAAAGAFAIALGWLSFVHFRETPPERPRIRFQITPSEKFRLSDFKLSPDGRFLAVVTDEGRLAGTLRIRELDSLESHILLPVGSVTVNYPFWSPDDEYIAFFSRGQLMKVARSGGPPVELCPLPLPGPTGGAWGSDGVILFGVQGAVFRVPATGGTPSKVPAPQASAAPELLPGGRFLVSSPDGIWMGSLGGAKPTRILTDLSSSAYVPPLRPGLTGHVLFVRGDTLMAQAFESDKGEPRGEIFPIAEQVGNLSGTRWAFSASANGVLVYGPGNRVNRELVWVDRKGRKLETATKPFDMPRNPMIALSPEDTLIAVPVVAGSSADYWVEDLTRKTFSRFTLDGSRSAVWSPDGKSLVFARNDGHRFLKTADGSGKEEFLFKNQNPTCPTCYLYDWSLDGKLIAFAEPGDKGPNIWLVSTEGDHKPFPYRESRFSEIWARFSPNSKWMAYQTDESGEAQIYVESIPAGKGRRPISTDGGVWPRWSRDGKELFYRQGNKMMAVPIRLTATAVEAGKPRVLFESNDDSRFEVARDGQRFLLSFPVEGTTALTPLTVDTNWEAGRTK